MTMSDSTLRLSGATFTIGKKALVAHVDLDVRPGEVVAVVGANGAGKTTLLRMLSGELAPTTGSASLDDCPLSRIAPDRLARRRAVLPQHSKLAFGLTAREVVLLGRTPHSTRVSVDADSVQRAMEKAGVAHLADQRYPTLSGGEQQRVHLARTLAQLDGDTSESRYLLLDEPTASLDLAHQHQTLRTARRVADSGAGVLAILHDLNLAAQHADRIAVMKDGRIVADGAPGDVLTPEIVAHALGIAVMVTNHPCATCPLVISMPDGATMDHAMPFSLPVLS